MVFNHFRSVTVVGEGSVLFTHPLADVPPIYLQSFPETVQGIRLGTKVKVLQERTNVQFNARLTTDEIAGRTFVIS